MPCNGLIYVPPHPCQCYIDVKINGFWALASAAASRPAGPETPAAARLERGPGYGQARPASDAIQPTAADWPAYRHDIRRSGSTTADVPVRLARLWEVRLGARASACTIGGGRVFAAAVDQHCVVALDAKDGRVLWDYTVGGRVDTPPTVYNDRVLFGSADGWVYCLRAADGVLVWRFRAAPDERHIVALGQLESLWPVHGTVLVSDGAAYVATGRSTHLDGGIRLYALKPETGELVRELRPSNEGPQGLEDVLVGDGDRVYMRQLEFGLKEGRPTASKGADENSSASSQRAFSTAGLLDDSCFSRVGWTTGTKAGKVRAGAGAKVADLLVFNGQSIFTFRTLRQGGFGGWFLPGTGAYELAALDAASGKARWTLKIPIRVQAIAAAGQTLFAAGPRDVVDPKDPWASIEGRAGSVLWVFAASDGKKLAEYALDAAPSWDGLAAANNRLFLSTLDGKVICFGGDH
jgi:outer membrane protein assembly factor BamB